jgi:molecular chaperone DnaK
MPKSTIPIGIDLGTTFSVVAYLDSTGRPCTITNAEGDLITPSVVLLDGASTVVGKEAVKAAGMEPEKIADFAKRDMGSMFYSKKVGGEQLPPEVIQSLILEKLRKDAELKLGPRVLQRATSKSDAGCGSVGRTADPRHHQRTNGRGNRVRLPGWFPR